MAIPKPGTAAAYRYNAIPKQPVKKPPVKKPPAVGGKDPYGSVPMIGGLTMTQIQGMTPQQIALWGAYQQSQGPDYSKLPTVNFSKLHQAAVAEAGKETASLVQPYQAEEARLKQNFQVSSQAAANFAAAFSAIAGGGNANIDDPAAQAYALKNFGGSYVGGMAATIGAQLINQQGAYWTEEDAKNAAQIKQITDASPGLAEKIYKSAVDDAVTQIKLGKSIADMSFKNKLGAIAALGKAMGGTGEAKGSWQTINGHRVWTVNGQIVNDAGYAGTGGDGGSGSSTKTKTYNGKVWQWNPATGKYDIPLGTAGTGGSSASTKTKTYNGKVWQWNPATGKYDIPLGTSGSGAAGGPGGPGAPTFSSAQYARAVKVGTTALQNNAEAFVAGAVAYADKKGWDDAKIGAFIQAKTNGYFGTWMAKVILAISPHLRDMHYTYAQIKAEAYKIVTAPITLKNGDTISVQPPKGYKVPKAKPASYNTSSTGLPGSQFANYTKPAPSDDIIYNQYKESAPMSDQQLVQVLSQAGFSGQGLQIAYSIAKRESGGNPLAFNPNRATQDRSWGLFQINTLGSMRSRVRQFGLQSEMQLLDPLNNAKAAYQMTNGGTNWYDWGVDTGHGAYRNAPVRMLPLPGMT